MVRKENAIEVRNIKKKFKVYFDKGHTLKEKVLHRSRNRYEEREVIRDISFDIKKGEAVGLVGHNGCGKSTTLKLLTRIIYPDSGTVKVNGRVSSLLELGAGFHPDMSGRENVYINASILGLSRKEIDERMEEIIEFSELEEFMDNPVRTYSSGMYMRLAFAVAINVDADILFIDEILAVGDTNFQVKCFNKLMEIKEKGTTIVIVSHSLGQIEQICDRSIWIHEGVIKEDGTPRNVHKKYLAYMGEKRNQKIQEKQPEEERIKEVVLKNDRYEHIGSGEIKVSDVYLTDNEGRVKQAFETAQDIIINIQFKVGTNLDKVNFGISIFRNDGVCCYGISTFQDGMGYFAVSCDGCVKLVLKNVALLSGRYDINVGIEDDIRNSVDYVDKACSFDIYTTDEEVGAFYLEHNWKIEL